MITYHLYSPFSHNYLIIYVLIKNLHYSILLISNTLTMLTKTLVIGFNVETLLKLIYKYFN